MTDIIRAVNVGYNSFLGNAKACEHADAVRTALLGGSWRDSLKKMSPEQIGQVFEGAAINVREGTKVSDAIGTALKATQESSIAGTQIQSKTLAGMFLGETSQAPKALDTSARGKVKPDTKVSHIIQQSPAAQKPAKTMGHMNQAQKAAFGLSALLAAFSAIGTLDALSKMKKKDPDGTTHIQPTQVGLALLNGLLTAGLGYAAFQQYHGR